MTETAPDTVAAASATPAPENNSGQQQQQGDGTQQRAPIPSGDDGSQQTPEFSLPDEYKDKPWAEKIKTQDDVYKQLENLNGLVGKKVIHPIDYETATPEQIQEHYSKLAPEDASKYNFGEGGDPEFQKAIGGVFKEFGINEHQASGIAQKIGELTKSMAEERKTADRSADGYMSIMKESFGENHEKAIALVETNLGAHLDDKDKGFMDDLDNTTKGAIDRAVFKISDAYEGRIKAILDEHGIKETSAHVGGSGGNPSTDISEFRKGLRKQINDLGSRAHSASEKQELVEKLNKTYL